MGLPSGRGGHVCQGHEVCTGSQYGSPRLPVTGFLGDASTAALAVAVIRGGMLDAHESVLPLNLCPACFLCLLPAYT